MLTYWFIMQTEALLLGAVQVTAKPSCAPRGQRCIDRRHRDRLDAVKAMQMDLVDQGDRVVVLQNLDECMNGLLYLQHGQVPHKRSHPHHRCRPLWMNQNP
jgi:hypothetical protein